MLIARACFGLFQNGVAIIIEKGDRGILEKSGMAVNNKTPAVSRGF